ncbi:glycosyltransferase family 2 protein, partial [Campylobacter volucris]|uniref:glycosyltransferase family 2 protein n=2 Tax=Campylobacter volucris TaxID=1031542 RepID=UPI00189EE180|nr:glycosyltransferase family 2 protein [Campylobacter volucris]
MKTVGVVIPIYNVEKYLKECLDSVVNQTYKNLQIILVNDGSTDENSLKIAKEYTLKDERFILFDKENGGLSSARNVGIEYFSGEYKLKNITTQIKESSLIEFELDGNNPYNIYKVYKSYKAFNDEKDLTNFTYPIIDYIIFLDSDDYWELNCIEECVPRMDGVEVVWFDFSKFVFIDNKKHVLQGSKISSLGIKKNRILNVIDWLNLIIFYKNREFYFGWHGMICFNYLKNINLKFLNYIIWEDVYFGTILFINSNKIFVNVQKLYCYRIRNNSISNHFSSKDYILSPFLEKLQQKSGIKIELFMKFYSAYSKWKTSICIIQYIQKIDNKIIQKLSKKAFYYYLINWAFDILKFYKYFKNFNISVLLLNKIFLKRNNVKLLKFLNYTDVLLFLKEAYQEIKSVEKLFIKKMHIYNIEMNKNKQLSKQNDCLNKQLSKQNDLLVILIFQTKH